jgi:hypothetical protein
MKSIAMMIVAACLLVAADEPAKLPKDAQAKFEPRSEPGAGQALLRKFVGEWRVEKAFFPRTGEPVRATGRCRQSMIHDGRFLQSDFVFEREGKSTTGQGLIGFEPETGIFTSVWTDSRQTKMSMRVSRDPFDGQRIVLYSKSLESEGPEVRRSKTITHLEADSGKLIHRQYALTPGGEERLMMELVMTREPAGK